MVAVGDWTRSVPVSGNGRVTYSLLTNTLPIETVVIKFNGVDTDRLTGSDLRKVAGNYFFVGTARGQFALTVEAYDNKGCKGVSDRPMTVNVK